jgi:VanZ family protein
MRIALPPPAYMRALCLIAFLAVIVQLFLLPVPPVLRAASIWDKVMHAMAFGSFAALLWFGIGFRAPFLNGLGITVLGALDEFHQIFIPTRTADIMDIVADAVGAAIVTFVLHRLASAPAREVALEEPLVETGD